MDEGDLPRIIVEEDSIFVEEGDWVARDVDDEDVEEFRILKNKEGDEKEKEALEELAVSYGEELVEEALDGVESLDGLIPEEKKSLGDFYDAGSSGSYEEIGAVEYDVSSGQVDERPEEVWGKRSGLEIAGFRDEEAEKMRRRRRDEGFG